MKHILTAIILALPLIAFCQDYLLEFDRYNSVYNYDWRGFEALDEYEVKKTFVQYVTSNDLLIRERHMLELMEKELRFSLKAVDLNDDQQTDIIYQGPHGGEGSLVYIFIQSYSSFNKIFTTGQGIVKVDWEGNLLDKLYVHDWGCCADPNLTNSVYQVEYIDNLPTFTLIWQSIELEDFLVKPKTYYQNPKRFEIVNEEYKLRGQPFIDDSTQNYHLEIKGNTIGVLKKGFKGTAYAFSEDITGRIWWYVIIDREYELKNAYIKYPYYDFKPHLVGWISSRYVKELF